MADVLASVQIQVTTPGFPKALKDLEIFSNRAKAAEAGANALNAELKGLTGTIQKFVGSAKALKDEATAMSTANRSLTAHARGWTNVANAISKAAAAAAAAKAAGVATGPAGAAPGGGARGGALGGGAHGFLSMSSSGLHAGVLGQISPAIAGVTMAAEVGISVVQSFFGAIVDGAKAAVQASMQMDQIKAAMHVVAGGEEGVAREMKFVMETANRLALPLVETSMAYAKLGAAAGDSTVKQNAAKTAFLGVATAARAMHLSAGDTSGAIKALVDMMSKNQVMSEELKKQLGNRLPGAMRIAGDVAKDMGLELNDALTKGVLKGEKAYEFMAKFGERLQNEFGGAANVAAQNFASGMVRMENSMVQLGDAVARTGLKDAAGAALSGFAEGVQTITRAIEDFIKSPAGTQFYDVLVAVGQTVGELISEFARWGTTMDGDKTFVTALTAEIEKLVPFLAMMIELLKVAALNVKAMAQYSSGDILGGVKTMLQANKAMAELPDAMVNAEQRYVVNRQLQQVKRDMEAADKKWKDQNTFNPDGPGRADMPPDAAPDKKLQKLIEKQQEFLKLKEHELYLQEALGTKTSAYIQMARELDKIGLARINKDGSVDTLGSDKERARSNKLLDHAKAMDAMKAEEAATIASQKAAQKYADELEKLRNKVQNTSGSNFKAYEEESMMLEVLRMNRKITTQEYIDYLEVLKRTYIDGYAAMQDASKALDDEEQKRDRRIQNKYGKGGMTDDAKRDRVDMFQWKARRSTNGLLTNPEDIALYSRMMDDYRRKTDETYKAVAQAIDSAMGVVENSMMDFATKTLRNWVDFREGMKRMIADILAEIARMIIRLTVIKPMMDYLKSDSGGGSWMSALSGMFGGTAGGGGADGLADMWSAMGMAHGGPVGAGRAYTVGERGPETFVPAVNGTVVPNGASGGVGSVSVVVNVDNKGNETGGTDAKNSADGLGDRLRQVVVEEIRNQSRTGGHLYNMKYRGA